MFNVTVGKRDADKVIHNKTYAFDYFCEALDWANDCIGAADFITITLAETSDCIAWYDREERCMVME